MCHIHESKKPLKMIYFAESINIKDIFQRRLDEKERRKPETRSHFEHKSTLALQGAYKKYESSLTTNFLFHTPYAIICQRMRERTEQAGKYVVYLVLVAKPFRIFCRQIYDFVCAAIESYCFCEIKMLMHSIILCCCWGFTPCV